MLGNVRCRMRTKRPPKQDTRSECVHFPPKSVRTKRAKFGGFGSDLPRHMPCALSLSRLSQAQRDRSHQVVLGLRGALGFWPTLVSTTIFETKLLIFRIHYYHSAMAKTRNSTSTAAASSAFLLKAAPGGKKRVVVPRPKTYDVSSIGRAVLELGFYN